MAEDQDVLLKVCYHCGETCRNGHILKHDRNFCCSGCLTVFELLSDNGLCNYYAFGTGQGINPEKSVSSESYGYLDDESVSGPLIRFRNAGQAHITFRIPSIHCSSCIWLLENLHTIEPAVISSRVDFLRKEATIVFAEDKLKLSELAALLARVGYEPYISLESLSEKENPTGTSKTAIIKIGVAGFAFGNIMMLSFPEYFGLAENSGQKELERFFGGLNLLLALPVLFYSASEFFVSAWKAASQKLLNIDAPIALAIATTFLRSVYEIFTGTGTGYLDSMTGIVFFMLLGRYFQNKTYSTLSFERDYRSYFPVGTMVKTGQTYESKPVHKLRKGDVMRVRNGEIIPADALLLSEQSHVDYSFITGESVPVKKQKGELIYAGAKQVGAATEMVVVEPVSQSYLTQLWNKGDKQSFTPAGNFIDLINKWFTVTVLSLAFLVSVYWYFADPSRILNAFTAILIVACPCGLLLTSTFAYGNMLRIFGLNKFYLKNSDVISKLAQADTVVFDKTGTITRGNTVLLHGVLNEFEKNFIFTLASQSSHPLSRAIAEYLKDAVPVSICDFSELPGQGISARSGNTWLWMGSAAFVGLHLSEPVKSTRVFIRLNDDQLGYFEFRNAYHPGLKDLARRLSATKQLFILTGDNDSEEERLRANFGPDTRLLFNQRPADKMEFVRRLQRHNKKVMMVGDGLNDAGALKESFVGIAVSDDTNTFSPACDAIIAGSALTLLPDFIRLSMAGRKVIIGTFFFSAVYNIVGLYFAVRGILSPVIAAILMPASSISIVILTTVLIRISAMRLRSRKADEDHILP